MTDIFSGGFVVPASMVGGTTYDGGKGGYFDKMQQTWAEYGPRKKIIIAFLVIAVIAVIVIVVRDHHQKPNLTPVTPTVGGFMARSGDGKLLDKLHEKGWQVHTRAECGWCDKQKKGVNGLKYHPINIDCDNPKNAHKCAAAPGYPHWQNTRTGESYPGYKTREQLEAMLGYAMEDEERAMEEEARRIDNMLYV
jgi:hypothetical protein